MFGLRRRPGSPGWGELLGDVGRSALDLLGAEAASAREELSDLARRGIVVLAIGLVAGALGFWAIGAAMTAAISGLAVWLPVWGASLVLFGALGLVALALFLVARARLRRLENPGAILMRRVESHLEFWREEVLGVAEDASGPATPRRSSARKAAERGSRRRPAVSMAPPDDEDFLDEP
ncbi:MAG TPA: phage holin family protein [Thermoanaerobaculia bacterium]|nr:phage holin family protein [Thermoanaerobaculia bacterium]